MGAAIPAPIQLFCALGEVARLVADVPTVVKATLTAPTSTKIYERETIAGERRKNRGFRR